MSTRQIRDTVSAVNTESLCSHYCLIRSINQQATASGEDLSGERSSCILHAHLQALPQPRFKPLASIVVKELSTKTSLLLALALPKCKGDLHAYSVDSDCIRFGPGDCSVTLRPSPCNVPKSLSSPFRTQTVSLSALLKSSPSRNANAQSSACPIRAFIDHLSSQNSLFAIT